jgi:hypothetical protein
MAYVWAGWVAGQPEARTAGADGPLNHFVLVQRVEAASSGTCSRSTASGKTQRSVNMQQGRKRKVDRQLQGRTTTKAVRRG